MEIEQTTLSGLKIIHPTVQGDDRGFFMEAFNKKIFAQSGIDLEIFQHNQSHSGKDVVRGLHFQWDKPLSKLMRVVRGKAFIVAVDIRKNSSTRGKWVTEEVSADNKLLVFAPFGFASGFRALEDNTDVEYYYDAYYNKEGESNIIWNDSEIGIPWGIQEPTLSPRDMSARTFKEWLASPESDFIL